MNALAGGGTFATLPALIALGLPGPVANATSNVALQPGAFASAWTYRDGLEPIGGLSVRAMAAISFAGGVAGSLLLVATTARTFDLVVPWLLLVATVAIALGPRLTTAGARVRGGTRGLVVAQALLGVYGGYFGGGVGLMMVATYGILAGVPPHRMAAPRTLALACANAAATIVFVANGMVRWAACLPMIAGAVAGGYLGARLGKRLSPGLIRGWTLGVTAVTTAVFFWRAYS